MEIFQTMHNEPDSVKEGGEKAKKPVSEIEEPQGTHKIRLLIWKFPWKSCSTLHLPVLSSNSKILKAFPKTLLNEMKPTINTQQKKKEMRQEKQKKRGGEKATVF